jgi:hypothetical protein
MITAAEFRHGCCSWGTPVEFFTLVGLPGHDLGQTNACTELRASAPGRGPVAARTPPSTSKAYPRAIVRTTISKTACGNRGGAWRRHDQRAQERTETHCLAGVVGLELRNPYARYVTGILTQLS